jgi:hypothetical protein
MNAFVLVVALAAQDASAPPPPPPPPLEAPATPPPVMQQEQPAVAPEKLPEKPPEQVPEKVAQNFGYDEGFFLASDDHLSKLRIRGLVQPRFALVAPLSGAGSFAHDATASFAVQRAQIELLGHVFTKDITFDLKTEFGRGTVFMKDAYIEGKLGEGAAFLRAGLYKRPFQRQQMASDWRLAFFERNLTEEAWKGGRDIGVSLHNGIDKGPTVEWSVGVYSGTSEKPKVTGDVDLKVEDGINALDNVAIGNVPKLFSPTFVGRVGFNSSAALKPYSEFDIDGGPFRAGVSLSAMEGFDLTKDTSLTRLCLDAIAKIEHVTATGAVIVSLAQDAPGAFTQSPDGVGGFVQAGWLLFDRVQPALRYSIVDELVVDEASAGMTHAVEHELVANITVLLFGQNVLWGVEGGSNIVDGEPDLRLRTQAQIAF